MLLDFGHRTRTGVSNMVWSLAPGDKARGESDHSLFRDVVPD